MKILIVDDCKEYRDVISAHVRKTKSHDEVECEQSHCLTDALEKLRINYYDSIILDLCLPETDGLETVNTVVHFLKYLHRDIPIIILTGSGDYKMGRKMFKLGIKDYLIKGEEEEGKQLRRAISFATYARNLPTKNVAS